MGLAVTIPGGKPRQSNTEASFLQTMDHILLLIAQYGYLLVFFAVWATTSIFVGYFFSGSLNLV
jgi:hypothetical protein